MIKRNIYLFFQTIYLIYIISVPKRIKFLNLNNLDFTKADFTNYKKIKLLIFKKNFIKKTAEPQISNFDFLKYSIKIGGKNGIEISKQNVFQWFKINKYKISKLWESDAVANRILNLIYNFDYINSLSSKFEEAHLKKIINVHINFFSFQSKFIKLGELSILQFKANILSNLVTNKNNYDYDKIFNEIIKNQLDSLSVHKSYNMLEHTKFINHLSEIINILLRFNKIIPTTFYITKLKMVTVLSQYFHKDGSLVLFNGSNNNYINQIMIVLKEESNIRKMYYPEEKNGLFFYEDKNKKIFFDLVQPSKSIMSRNLNASTLAIEFSSGKEKIITNCGALEKTKGNASYLRYTAAHSTIALKNTNISEIRENQPHLKFPQSVDFKRSQYGNLFICEGSHNGYLKNFKKIIKRKLTFQESEESIFGEDHIISSISKNNEVIFHIRFHIMSNINIVNTNNKRSVILKTKNKHIWTFRASADIVLEESIFVDKDDTIKTNQIVIKGITKNTREVIKWSLTKI